MEVCMRLLLCRALFVNVLTSIVLFSCLFLAGLASAQSKDTKKSKAPEKRREKNIIVEKKIKYKKGDKTEYDFDAIDIGGDLKTPMGSLVDSLNSNKDYDFVKIRLKWTPEMLQSASSLETGKGSK